MTTTERFEKVAAKNRTGDLIGEKFGKWTVISQAGCDTQGRAKLLCICDCGTQKTVDSYSLRSGGTKSCGLCYETAFNSHCDNADGSVTVFCINDKTFLVDADDLPLIKPYKWHVNNRGYVATGSVKPNLRLHRVLFGLDENSKAVVDHISGETCDNRRANLRVCTEYENMRNQTIGKRNSSGFKGVSFWKRKQKYIAEIVYRDKSLKRNRVFLGSYDSPILAARAYDRAALLYHGEYAKTNEMLGLLEVSKCA